MTMRSSSRHQMKIRDITSTLMTSLAPLWHH